MDDKKTTRFHFDFGGIELELRGEKEFVQSMYREILRDVEKARGEVQDELHKKRSHSDERRPREPSIWVHRATSVMRKIYLLPPDEIRVTAIGQVLKLGEVKSIYIDKEVFADFFPEMDKGKTLWAEFTPEGRERIAEATEPMRKALRTELMEKKDRKI